MIDTQSIRKKILDLALQGKLTEQLPEDGTAEELFQRIQQEKSIQKKTGKRKKGEPDASPEQRDIPFELPSSWMWVEISEIFSLQAGKNITADRIADKQSDSYSYPCYGGNGLRGFVEQYNTSGLHALIGRQGALCGNINFAEGYFYATEHAVVVDVYAETDTIWAGLFLKALNLNQYATSVAQPGLAVNRIEKVLIPLPPILEQKRIVEKIKSSYSVLNTIDTLQSQYQDNLAALKSKIIDAGIQGKLTEQLPEDGTAEELYQQIQQEKLALEKAGKIKKSKPLPPISDEEKPFDIPDNWKWVRIGSIANSIFAGGDKPEDFSKTSDDARKYPVVGNGIERDGLLGYTAKPTAKANSVTVAGRGTIGFSVYRDYEYCPIVRLIVIEQNINIDPQYLQYTLRALPETGVGSSIPQLTVPMLIPKVIPLPPLAEQKRIVAKLEELLPLCEGSKGKNA